MDKPNKKVVRTIYRTKYRYKTDLRLLFLAFLYGWVFSIFVPIRVIDNPLKPAVNTSTNTYTN